MMKLKSIYSLAASLVLFAACGNDVETDLLDRGEQANLLRIESVTQDGFLSEEDAATRATYDGYKLSFVANQDQLGLILLDKDNNRIGHGSFRFNGSIWQNENKEGTQFFSGKTAKVIAYFPYDETLSADINSLDELKNAKVPTTDQSTEENFKKSDLLVCELSGEDVKAALSINFTHAFSLVGLAAQGKVSVDGKDYPYNLSMSDVAMAIGEDNYMPYVLNGTYVCLVKPGTELTNGSFRYFYNIGGTTYVKTPATDKSVTPAAGMRYTFPCVAGGAGEAPELSVGDFYCVDNNTQKVVVIPNNAGNIPTELTCKGIVFHVMNDTDFGTFATNNGLSSNDYQGFNGKHGLVASVKNGSVFGSVGQLTDLVTVFANVSDATSKEVANGFIMTKTLNEAVSAGSPANITFTSLDNHKEDVVAGATTWYVPSIYELLLLARGNQPTVESKDGLVLFNNQLNKIADSEQITTTLHAITIHATDGGIWLMTSEGKLNDWHANIPVEVTRPICAF